MEEPNLVTTQMMQTARPTSSTAAALRDVRSPVEEAMKQKFYQLDDRVSDKLPGR